MSFDIVFAGVGGQGIGLLAETVARAADAAGLQVRGVDTHGLAQRGGAVASHLRIGSDAHGPLVRARRADLVCALERHEALRAAGTFLKDGGTIVVFDTVWQPLGVRTKRVAESPWSDLERAVAARAGRLLRVFRDDLPDARYQNAALLAEVSKQGLIPGLSAEHYRAALSDILGGEALERNLEFIR